MGKMKSIKMDRDLKTGAISGKEAQEELEKYHDVSLFNKCIEEETRAISNIAKTFVRRNDYYKKFGQRDLSIDKHGQEYDLDPRITYFKKCLQEQDLALPILDKIFKKTLCLQNYLLTDGNCRGLAAACEFLDYHLVNRFLFNNCGITGK